MSDFIISFDLFGEYDNFEDWDAAVEEEERRKYEKKKEKRHKEVTPEESNKLEDDKDEINKENPDMGSSWLTKTWTSTLKATLPLLSMTFAIILCVCPVDQGRGRIQCCQFEESESRYLTPFK